MKMKFKTIRDYVFNAITRKIETENRSFALITNFMREGYVSGAMLKNIKIRRRPNNRVV